MRSDVAKEGSDEIRVMYPRGEKIRLISWIRSNFISSNRFLSISDWGRLTILKVSAKCRRSVTLPKCSRTGLLIYRGPRGTLLGSPEAVSWL